MRTPQEQMAALTSALTETQVLIREQFIGAHNALLATKSQHPLAIPLDQMSKEQLERVYMAFVIAFSEVPLSKRPTLRTIFIFCHNSIYDEMSFLMGAVPQALADRFKRYSELDATSKEAAHRAVIESMLRSDTFIPQILKFSEQDVPAMTRRMEEARREAMANG